jgi:hypothetical protein
MDYCTPHFGKKLGELTLEDLENYFKIDRPETDQIEFKSFSTEKNFDKNIEPINKAISALLNSNGGILIWGAPIGKKIEGKKEKIFKGDLTYSKEPIEKDTLISKISDKIIPLPTNIRVKELAENKLFIFEIDQSEYAPHQTGSVYYMRIDGQSRPAPHHYIDALFKKVKYPDIRGHIKIDNWNVWKETMPNKREYHLRISIIIFNLSKLQNDYNPSYNVLIDKGWFQNSKYPTSEKNTNYEAQGTLLRRTDIKDVIFYGEPTIETFTIIIPVEEAERPNSGINIVLFFGTKTSPMKCSRYKIKLSPTLLKTAFNEEMFAEIFENQLISDYQEELGRNDEDTLKIILQR